jgi:hypothetical protein
VSERCSRRGRKGLLGGALLLCISATALFNISALFNIAEKHFRHVRFPRLHNQIDDFLNASRRWESGDLETFKQSSNRMFAVNKLSFDGICSERTGSFNTNFTLSKLQEARSACETALTQLHQTRPKYEQVQSPYQRQHDKCRGWRLLHGLTDMFVGVSLFLEENCNSHRLHGVVFDCRRENGTIEALMRSWSVHDVTFFARCVYL